MTVAVLRLERGLYVLSLSDGMTLSATGYRNYYNELSLHVWRAGVTDLYFADPRSLERWERIRRHFPERTARVRAHPA